MTYNRTKSAFHLLIGGCLTLSLVTETRGQEVMDNAQSGARSPEETPTTDEPKTDKPSPALPVDVELPEISPGERMTATRPCSFSLSESVS